MKWWLVRGLSWKEIASEVFRSIVENDTLDVAAALAFFSLLSLFPFAILVLTLIGYVPIKGLEDQVTALVHELMPADAARVFETVVHEIVGRQHGVLLAVSLGGSLWTSSSAISSAIVGLNRAQNAKEKRPYWKVKGIALAMTLLGVALMVIATGALAIGPGVARHIWDWFGLGGIFDVTWRVVRWPLIILAMMLTLAFAYWILPDVRRPFRFVSPGAVLAVLLWLGGSFAFGVYVSHFGAYAKSYGTLGGAVVLLTWLWLSSLAVLIGGEVNAVLDRAADHALEKGTPDVRREHDPQRETLHHTESPQPT